MPRPSFAGLVFDCDGLLVETGRFWREAFEVASGEALTDEMFAELAGASTRTASAYLSDKLGIRVEAEAIEEALLAATQGEEIAPLPGVENLLQAAHGKLPTALATNGPEPFVRALLGERLGRYFDHVIASEAAGADKPKPAVYVAACQAIGVPPGRAAAFEDSLVGAQSAMSAGLALLIVNATPPEIAADLVVDRIDQPTVFEFLGLDSEAG